MSLTSRTDPWYTSTHIALELVAYQVPPPLSTHQIQISRSSGPAKKNSMRREQVECDAAALASKARPADRSIGRMCHVWPGR